MGNGSKNTPDVPKARPWAGHSIAAAIPAPDQITEDDLVTVEDIQSPGSGALGHGPPEPAAPIDFCERVHVLRFQTLDGALPQLGQAIRIVIANPPRVANVSGEHIGSLADPCDSAILQCVVDGYAMIGQVVSVETGGQYGKVRVSGRLHADPH